MGMKSTVCKEPPSDASFERDERARRCRLQFSFAQSSVGKTARGFEHEKVGHVARLIGAFGAADILSEWWQHTTTPLVLLFASMRQLYICLPHFGYDSVVSGDHLSGGAFDLGLCARDTALVTVEDW